MVKIRSVARLDTVLVDSLRDTLLKSGTIDQLDVDQLIVSDSPANVVAQIVEAVAPRLNLRFEQAPRRRWWLFEWPAQGDDRKPTHRVGGVELHRQVRREQSTIEYKEEGTTSTLFDMCVWNDLDLIHSVPGVAHRAAPLKQEMDRLIAHRRTFPAAGTICGR